jgi:hypothetical protein
MRTPVFLDAFDVIELQNSSGVQFRVSAQTGTQVSLASRCKVEMLDPHSEMFDSYVELPFKRALATRILAQLFFLGGSEWPPQLSDLVIVDLFEGDLRLVYDCMFDPFAGNEGPPLWQARYNKAKRHWSISAVQRPP